MSVLYAFIRLREELNAGRKQLRNESSQPIIIDLLKDLCEAVQGGTAKLAFRKKRHH
jgi:hypothetical protein